MPARSADPLAPYRKLLTTLGKRPRTVLEHILKNGSVSTYELGQLGYDQPPRAAQDLKEAGVQLTTTFGKHPTTNARMAIYSLRGIDEASQGSGRRAFPKAFRREVLDQFQNRCNICNVEYADTVLQLDHRIPYIVGGEPDTLRVEEFQPLCGSHQRLKSWACEHCENRHAKKLDVCRTCYWATPDGDYVHIANRHERRVDLTWAGDGEIRMYSQLVREAANRNVSLATHLRQVLADYVAKRKV